MYDYGSCPFRATNWMSISDSVNKKSELIVNSSLSLFLSSLKDLIRKGDTSDLPILRAAINKSNQEYSISRAQVSQSFYEAHLDRSMKLCGIWNYIRKNKFNNPEEKLQYQQILDKLIIGVDTENKILNPVTINAPSALIATENQIGNNTVNIFNGKKNIANSKQIPIFEFKGLYGTNLLNENVSKISADTVYSLSAMIPDDKKLKVVIVSLKEDKKPFWSLKLGTERGWIHSIAKDGEQMFDLNEPFGDINIHFEKKGSAKIKIYYQEAILNEKTIEWE